MLEKYILDSSSQASLESFGGKAYALQQLQSFNIPKWVVITPQTKNDIDIAHPDFQNDFIRYIDSIFEEGTLFAVRSSAIEEDGEKHSFAGLLESYLNLSKTQLIEHIIKVWDSINAPRVHTYKQTHNIEMSLNVPAVIIQKMVNASAAGVCFSAEPISGDKEIQLINVIHGLGNRLVDGDVNSDTIYIKNAQVEHYKTVEESAVLNEQQAIDVAALALKCAQNFNAPQDIEFAFENETLFLLQSRPISTIMTPIQGEQRLWDNSNIVESYAGVTTPLTYSFARYVYEEVYYEFCTVLRVPKDRVQKNRLSFKTMLGLVDGHIYYNLMSWYRILALLPGFKFNREFMEQMMGVKEGLPESIVTELMQESKFSRYSDALSLGSTLYGLITQQRKINTTIKNFYSRLNTALIPNSELKNKNIDELVAHYRNLEDQLLKQWDAPLINDFLAMIYFGVLGKLCKKWLGADEYLQNDLLIGDGEIISAKPAKLIVKMADKVRMMGEGAIDILMNKDIDFINEWLPNQAHLQNDIEAYLEEFQDRTLDELKLESFTLFDDATPLYRAIASMAMRKNSYHDKSDVNQRDVAFAKVQEHLKEDKIKLKVMNYVIHQARERVTNRENLRFERTRLFGHIRRIFLEIGTQLVSINKLANARDIFYLEVNEILSFVEGTSTCTHLSDLALLKKREFKNYHDKENRGDTPHDRFHTNGPVYYNNSFKTAIISKNSSDSELSGFGCCPGIVKGKVRVIHNPQDTKIEEGEILVALQTDPGWIMLFPASSAILVQRGSMLSHSAIVAREMGIPAIVSIDNLLDKLQTGDVVEMNGATGEITIVKKLL